MTRSQLRPSLTSAAACVAFGLVVAACSTPTTETSVWKNPSYAGGPMTNIAVFGGRMSETQRRLLEDGFVNELAAYGVHAAPSYSLFPEGQVPQDQVAVRAALQKGGFDGALVSTLKNVREQVYVAPASDWSGGFYGAFWGPGPVDTEADTFVKFETSLWSPNTGKMVWSTTTQTENPTSNKNFVSSLTGKVVPSLSKAGVIPPKPGQPVSIVGAPESPR
jgi:hypothetical protein